MTDADVRPRRERGHPQRPPETVIVRRTDEPTAAALLAAAVEMMSMHGFHGTSVRDIATAAGASPAALYHHFGSKDDLLTTILDRGMDLLVHRTEDALFDAPRDAAVRLRAIVGAHVEVHIDAQRESLLGNSELRSLLPAARALVVSKRDAQQRTFDRVVRDGVRHGVFSTRHPAEAARVVVTACTAVAAWYRPDGELSPATLVQRYQQVALDAVGYRR